MSTPLSSSPAPLRPRPLSGPSVLVPRPAPRSSEPLPESRVAPLPRNLVDPKSIPASRLAPAVSGVLLGIQGAAALLGAPAVASAQPQETPQLTPELLAALAEASTAEATSVASSILFESGFEARWAEAKAKSLTAKDVRAAIAELGPAATQEKLSALLSSHESKLDDSGLGELRGAIVGHSVREAAADGKLTAGELKTISATFKLQWGKDAAEAAVVRASGGVFQHLDKDAAKWLLERVGSVDRHAGRVGAVLDEMMKGKNTLVDSNYDGVLDAKDLIFTETDGGKISVAPIGQTKASEVRIATALVDASYKMNDAGVAFKLIKDHTANPDYWTIGAGGTLQLKPGVSAAEAVKDIVENGHKYGFECATGLVATYYVGMLDVLGPKDFDRVASDLVIGPWHMEDDLDRLYRNYRLDPMKGVETDMPKDHALVPGGYYYFRNWDVTDDARARGWQGENVIYLGGGKFYGHGIGLGDASLFVNKLASEMKDGGKTPSLLNLTATVDADLVKLDLHPGQ